MVPGSEFSQSGASLTRVRLQLTAPCSHQRAGLGAEQRQQGESGASDKEEPLKQAGEARIGNNLMTFRESKTMRAWALCDISLRGWNTVAHTFCSDVTLVSCQKVYTLCHGDVKSTVSKCMTLCLTASSASTRFLCLFFFS